jgi:signal transduction histidine kinase
MRSDGEVRLEVHDRGKGLPAGKQLSFSGNGTMGVGLRGMRERILQLGGSLSVQSNAGGTTIVATFPITATADASNSEPVVA